MRLGLGFILIFLFSCSSEKEQYEMIQFGKSKEKPNREDAILYRHIQREKEELLIFYPDQNEEIQSVLYSLGKGDLIKIKDPSLKPWNKGDQIQIVSFRNAEEIKKLAQGFEVEVLPEKEELIRYFFESEIPYTYEKAVFIYRKELSGSGIKGKKNSIYRVAMECELLNGKKVYSTEQSADLFEFNKSMPGQITEGLAYVMDLMEEGDEFWAVIPSSLSFGENGIENIIPPNEALVYKLKLIEIII